MTTPVYRIPSSNTLEISPSEVVPIRPPSPFEVNTGEVHLLDQAEQKQVLGNIALKDAEALMERRFKIHGADVAKLSESAQSAIVDAIAGKFWWVDVDALDPAKFSELASAVEGIQTRVLFGRLRVKKFLSELAEASMGKGSGTGGSGSVGTKSTRTKYVPNMWTHPMLRKMTFAVDNRVCSGVRITGLFKVAISKPWFVGAMALKPVKV
jgi:hypothetical protein